MSLETLAAKYIASAERVLNELTITQAAVSIGQAQTQSVIGYARDYLEDAKYYKQKQRFETSLTSIAYCEGLLDALRLLGAVKFEWPAKPETKTEREL